MIKRNIFSFIIIAGLIGGLIALGGCSLFLPEQSSESKGFDWTSAIFVVFLILLFYLFIIRPQMRRRKEQQKVMEEIKPGDQVIAAGGIYGVIQSISEDSLVIKVESGASIRVTKQGLLVKPIVK